MPAWPLIALNFPGGLDQTNPDFGHTKGTFIAHSWAPRARGSGGLANLHTHLLVKDVARALEVPPLPTSRSKWILLGGTELTAPCCWLVCATCGCQRAI